MPFRKFTKEETKAYEKLVKDYLEIQELDSEIKQVKDPGAGSFCANAVWYGYLGFEGRGFKKRLVEIVGNHSPYPGLKSSEIYDLVYHGLYNQLPNCRNCWCG